MLNFSSSIGSNSNFFSIAFCKAVWRSELSGSLASSHSAFLMACSAFSKSRSGLCSSCSCCTWVISRFNSSMDWSCWSISARSSKRGSKIGSAVGSLGNSTPFLSIAVRATPLCVVGWRSVIPCSLRLRQSICSVCPHILKRAFVVSSHSLRQYRVVSLPIFLSSHSLVFSPNSPSAVSRRVVIRIWA